MTSANPRRRPRFNIEFMTFPVNGPGIELIHRIFKRVRLVILIAIVPSLLALYWWFHPAINLRSFDLWNFIIFFILAPFWFYCRIRHGLANRETAVAVETPVTYDAEGRIKANSIDTEIAKRAARTAAFWLKMSWLPAAVLVTFVMAWAMSSVVFPGNAMRYASIMTVSNRDFATDIQDINYSEIPVIDRESATLLGNRVMGEIPEYVSQFIISDLYSQINFQGQPVRVSPLAYADLYKWFTNRAGGLPGYVLVNTASQNASIVRLKPGETMLFSQSEPLGRNIDRHVQLKYPFYMFDQKSFEIDEEGRPWWVCPVQTRRIGLFGGTDITRVVLCDASTGECTDLPIDECPTWVDRVYPADLVLAQYNWHGAYGQGWINSWLGQKDVVQTTPGSGNQLGYNYIATGDDVWVYTGITSATSDSSIVGFLLVNQRTAEARFYPMAGATEVSAMHSAQGQVQHLGYRATFPLLVNIYGQPTYFMALKDNAGLVKMYAMLDIQRYQNVAVGDSVIACQQSYLALLMQNGIIDGLPGDNSGSGAGDMIVVPGTSTPVVLATASGRVSRIATAVIDGNSHFYLTLEGDPAIYDCALPEVMAVLTVSVGDTVELTYYEYEPFAVVIALE